MPQLTSKSQVTIPKSIRERLGVEPGEAVEFVVVGDHVEVRSAAHPSAFEAGRHLFGTWASGQSDTSVNRKQLLNEVLDEKHARRHR
jgi:AbrB family looped-hinge helix DNA binding protein